MRIEDRTRVGPVIAAGALALLAFPASGRGEQPTLSTHPAEQPAAEVRAYWTAKRMAAAEPLDGPVSPGAGPTGGAGANAAAQPPDQEIQDARYTAYPERLHGKLFVTVGSTDATCSATVVHSFTRNLILTAGHCVVSPPSTLGGRPTWSTNVMFVPGYHNGSRPFGTFVATRLRAPVFWSFEADISLDIGAVNLAATLGGPIEQRLGSRGVAFNRPRRSYPGRRFRIFGYPGEPALFYDAERLILCNSPFRGFERFTGSVEAGPCHQQQGSSGGGWVIHGGLVNSVVSHGGCSIPGPTCSTVAGTYFGDVAFDLWARAAGGLPSKRKRRLRHCNRIPRRAKFVRCRARAETFKPSRR